MAYSMLRLGGVCALLCTALTAHAGMFDDEEARRAILDLRQRVDALKRDTPDRAELDRRLTDQAQRTGEDMAALRRGILDMQNQLETMRAEVAKLRGQNEQLARDLSDVQRKQKDVSQAFDERLRRFEPQSVSVDGKDILATAAEKRDFDANLAAFRKGDFGAASTGFVDFLNRNPQTGYRASALFWLGNAEYANKDCKSAVGHLRSMVALAPDHMHAPEALLTVANCQVEARETKAARKTLDELISSYPTTDAANAAKDRLGRLK